MGRILRREHGNKRAAFAALLTTGMIAALLSLAALAAPSPAYAAELQGSGTADDPTLIYSTDDLIAWCNKLNDMHQSAERQQYARLMDDLTAPGPDGTIYGGAVTDDVINSMNHPDLQVAEFDGNSHLVELQLSSHGALFATGGQPGDAGTMTIKDFHFIGSVTHTQGGGCAGTLFEAVGEKNNPSQGRKIEIADCTNQASVSGDQATGGLIGSFYDNDHGAITIERCSNFGEIVSANGHAGGLAGSIVLYDSPSVVRYCTNNGTIKSMGGSFPTIDNDDAPDKPKEIGGSSGGLVGYLSFSPNIQVTLHHDYNQGGIYGSSAHGYCGGIVGFVDTPWTPINFVSACYNTGPIQPSSRTAEYAGGLFGYATSNTIRIDHSLTEDSSVPSGAVSDTTRNGTIVPSYVLSGDGYIYMDPEAYTWNHPDMFIYNDYPTLEGVGVARSVKVRLISPATSNYSNDYTYWNTVFSNNEGAYPQEGYSLAYWTREAPDMGSTWSKPPKEFKSDPNDIHDRIYGGEPVLYAYTVPSSATVEFDLNEPADGYECSLDPVDATKTIVDGEPVGALPTATCVNPDDNNDTRTFLGWATTKDGNYPGAEWISESSDNLNDFQNDATHTVTLYAQWADMSIPVEIVRQPKDYTISALAKGWSHKVFFDVGLSYPTDPGHGCAVQLQFKKDGGYYYEDVDFDHNPGFQQLYPQVYFDLESSKQASGDYRIKVEYYEPGNVLATFYTSSARVVIDIPQSEAEVSTVILKEDVTSDEIFGTHSYEVSGNILGDFPSLIDESVPGNFAHMAWIEDGSGNIVSTEKQYVDNVRSFTLKKQHLKEGQTYTLCVSRVMDDYFQPGRYQGESEPYRVSFAVPYADSVAASITEVQVTEEPVVQDGKAVDFTADYEVPLGGTFNLASDVQYTQPQPSNREVSAQWQYSTGKDWVDVPDELFAQDKKGKPIRGIVWSDDRTSARVYATLNAQAKLDGMYFRVKLTTPPWPTDTVSAQSKKALSLTVPTPEITNVKVTDAHVSVTWKWEDGAGSKVPSDGFNVRIERRDHEHNKWVYECGDQMYTYTYDATLDPQQDYRVRVLADVDGFQSSYAEAEFITQGETRIAWDNYYPYITADLTGINSITVDYDWASYNDGNHTVLYTWSLSNEKYDENAETAYREFFTTESDNMVWFPDDFQKAYDASTEKEELFDPMEAWWVRAHAEVYTLDENGDPAKPVDGTRADLSPLPVLHETTAPRNVTVKDVGSHSMTVCWDAPEKGLVREYKLYVGSCIRTVQPEQGVDGHFELKVDGLDSDTVDYGSIRTIDSRISNSAIAEASVKGQTLPSPVVGSWTATADKTAAKLGDTVTLSASYAANSGKFPEAEAQLQWYSWREGDPDWQPEGDPVSLDDASQDYTTSMTHTVTSDDYGRQWKLGVKANSPDESVTGSSNVVTVAVTPPTPTDVACDAPTLTSLPVSWTPVAGAEGYQIKCAKLGADSTPVSATTYSVAASSLTSDADGKLCYEVSGLEPNTTYRVSVAAYAYGASSEFSTAVDASTLAEPTIETPVFLQVPKTTWVEAGKDATFTAQASVGDGGAIAYTWERQGASEQDFAPIAQGDKYDMSEKGGVATLTVKNVGVDDVAAAFRCVATSSKDSQTASAASAAAYLTVTPAAPTDAQAQATSATTGEVTWTANGVVRRFVVTWQQTDGSDPVGSEYSKVVTIPNDATQGTCQLDGLLPGTRYEVALYAAPQVGFRSEAKSTVLDTPLASELDTATVSPDKQLVEPSETVTFKVETNVDGKESETLEYRWQRNAFGETWLDIEGEAGAKKELSVTAPEGGSVDGYRCIVTSTRTTTDKDGNVVGTDKKSVTSSASVLLTSVPVSPPVQLAAEPGTTSVHLTWASDDVRPLTYQVEYAEGFTPGDSDWTTVDNVGSSTSCDVEGLKANTAYSWRVQAVVRDQLHSEWAQADAFTTLEEPSALATVSVTPRWGVAVAGSDKGVTYTAVTNIDNALNGETLSYQWQESATGEVWSDVPGETTATFIAATKDTEPRSCRYRCVVTASKNGAALKTITSDPVNFRTTAQPPTSLLAENITAATADLSWTGSLDTGLSYRVFWRASGASEWTNSTDLTEAKYSLNSLMPATTYEWYVQVMNNGTPSVRSATSLFVTQSLSPVPQLTRVVVGPADQTPSATEQAKFTAYTNVDDMTGATMEYKWEKRDLDSDPNDSTAWTTIADKTTREIELPANTDGYVRCTVTYTPPASVRALSLAAAPVTSTNEARVRVMPAAPTGLTVSSVNETTADISWTGGANGVAFDLTYRAVGSSEWASMQGLSSAPTQLTDLKPGTAYEWNMRSVAYGASDDPLCSDWIAGPPFATNPEGPAPTEPKVEVAPERAAAVIGNGRTLTFTAMPNAAIKDDSRDKAYQWERYDGAEWVSVSGATSETLSIVANDAATAGASKYRCVVTIESIGGLSDVITTSNEVTCTLAPAAPTGLVASDITSDEAKLSWTWEKGGLQKADEFKVLYRESGAKAWETATATGDACEFTLEGLKPETVYEWRVQAVQNGVESLPSSSSLFVTASEHPDLKLESVLVDPSDQAVAPEAQATVKATTNLDGMADASELAYAWEKRALDSDPNASDAWTKIEGQTGSSVTLPVKTSGYVRCTVTYAPASSTVGDPVASNEVSVRVQPAGAPTNLEVKDIGDTGATFAWGGTLSTGGSFTLLYRTAGTDAWITVPKLTTSPYTATDLAPNTTYEWRMCTVSADGVASEWADGARFTTTASEGELGSVEVTPARVDAVAGDSVPVEDFSAAVSGAVKGQSLVYQWQVELSDGWTNLPAQTDKRTHLSVAGLEAGEHSLRCVVTATAPGGKSKTIESNQVVLALSPVKPTDLDVRVVTRDAATLAWTWAGPGEVESFNVQYRQEGQTDWADVPADSIDVEASTCAVEGLAPGTSYEWRVQAVQGGQASEWADSGFATQSDGSLKVARIWPPDVAVARDEQAKFAAFTNRGDAEDVSYEWQRRALDSEDADGSWETIPNATDRVLTLDANTTGYVRCVATQAASAAGAAEVVEAPEATEASQAAASNETSGANEAPETNETNEALATNETSEPPETGETNEPPASNETGEAPAANEAPATLGVSEVAETFTAPAPVAISNQARVRVMPSASSGLVVGEVGFTNAALSWAAADVDGAAFTLAYRVAGSQDWTEVSNLTAPSYELSGLVQSTPYEWRVQTVVGTGDDALESAWAYGDSFTTQTMKTYQVTAGADGTWKPGQPGLAFTIDAPRDKFLSLAVDGVELVQGTDYTVSDEGMTVTLSPDYLATLAPGEHELAATFSDGVASTSFAVASADPGPTPNPSSPTSHPDNGGKTLAPTGDPLTGALPLAGVLAAACAVTAALAAARLRRKRR